MRPSRQALQKGVTRNDICKQCCTARHTRALLHTRSRHEAARCTPSHGAAWLLRGVGEHGAFSGFRYCMKCRDTCKRLWPSRVPRPKPKPAWLLHVEKSACFPKAVLPPSAGAVSAPTASAPTLTSSGPPPKRLDVPNEAPSCGRGLSVCPFRSTPTSYPPGVHIHTYIHMHALHRQGRKRHRPGRQRFARSRQRGACAVRTWAIRPAAVRYVPLGRPATVQHRPARAYAQGGRRALLPRAERQARP